MKPMGGHVDTLGPMSNPPQPAPLVSIFPANPVGARHGLCRPVQLAGREDSAGTTAEGGGVAD